MLNQTYTELNNHGVSFKVSKWSGDDPLNETSNVVIANIGILHSDKSDLKILGKIDTLIIDETHLIKLNNQTQKLLKKVKTVNRFGFTGTLPDDMEDKWSVIGATGPIIYNKGTFELREKKFLSDIKVEVLELEYLDPIQPIEKRAPRYPGEEVPPLPPTLNLQREMNFIKFNPFRTNIIKKLVDKFTNNAIIMVDHIDHGEFLTEYLQTNCLDKKVFFIRGEVTPKERTKIQELMEVRTDIVCVAISKIFSTGINIKNLHYLIFAASGKAKVRVIQSIGRLLRLHDSKRVAYVFDLADQLHYGVTHLLKRIELYNKEKIKYARRKIREGNQRK